MDTHDKHNDAIDDMPWLHNALEDDFSIGSFGSIGSLIENLSFKSNDFDFNPEFDNNSADVGLPTLQRATSENAISDENVADQPSDDAEIHNIPGEINVADSTTTAHPTVINADVGKAHNETEQSAESPAPIMISPATKIAMSKSKIMNLSRLTLFLDSAMDDNVKYAAMCVAELKQLDKQCGMKQRQIYHILAIFVYETYDDAHPMKETTINILHDMTTSNKDLYVVNGAKLLRGYNDLLNDARTDFANKLCPKAALLGQLSNWVAMYEGGDDAFKTFTLASKSLLMEDFAIIFYATMMVTRVVSDYILPVASGVDGNLRRIRKSPFGKKGRSILTQVISVLSFLLAL